MRQLIQNITGIYGDAGAKWLDELPETVEALVLHWHLNDVTPVDNMTYNYVAKAVTKNHQHVVLKISCDGKTSGEEMRALRYFDGVGSIKLLDQHETYHAMLLEQAIPGVTLKSLYPARIEYVMDNYITTMKQLHNKRLPADHDFQHVRDWLRAFERVNLDQLPAGMLARAIDITNHLLSTMHTEILLHGDLHHDNLIQNKDGWLAIDPKGIIGDAAFEIAAFDIIHPSEFQKASAITQLFAQRIKFLADKSGLDPERIKNWVFVRLILSVAWSIEDNCEIGRDTDLAMALVPLLHP